MRIQATTDPAILAEAAPKLEALKKATQGVEAIFMKDLLSAMQKGIHKSTLPGGEIYQDLFNQAVADSAGKRGALGIANLLYRQLSPKVIGEVMAKHIQEQR